MTKFSDMIEVRNECGQLYIQVQMPTTEKLKVIQIMDDDCDSMYCEFDDGRRCWVHPIDPPSSHGRVIVEVEGSGKLYPTNIIKLYREKI